MIDVIGEELDDDCGSWHPNPRIVPTTNSGFQTFEWKLQTRIIRLQRCLEIIQNRALGPVADDEQSLVADEHVAWLREHDHILNSPAAGSLANRQRTSSLPAAN